MFRLKLDQLMFERNLNFTDVANLTGIRYSTVRDMRNNKVKVWSPEHLDKLMKLFNLTHVDQLIEYCDDDQDRLFRQLEQQLDSLSEEERQRLLRKLTEKYGEGD